MAEHSIAIRFGIENGAVVLRDLKAIGGNGEKALKRIEQAGKPASRALQAVSQVAGDVRSRIEGLTARFGSFGAGLMRLGPVGIAAAGLVAVAGAAAVVVGGLRKAIGITAEAIDTFDALDDQASQLGITAEKLQVLSFSGLQIGVKTEETVKALIKLNDNLGEVLIRGKEAPKELAIAFAKLRIPRKQIVATQGDLDQLLPAIADGLKNVETQAERTAIAQALFGKQGAKLLPLLTQGAAGLAEFSRQAHKGGAVLKKEYVDILSTAGDKLADLRDRAKVAGGVIGAEFAGVNVKLEEFKTRLYQAVAGWVERSGIGAKVEEELTRIGAAIEEMIAKAGGADAVFELIRGKAAEFFQTLTGGSGDVDGFVNVVGKRIAEAGIWFEELGKIINGVAAAVRGLIAVADAAEEGYAWLKKYGLVSDVDYTNITGPQFKYEPSPTAKWIANQARRVFGGGRPARAPPVVSGPPAPLASNAPPAMRAAPAMPVAPPMPAAPQTPGRLTPAAPQTPVPLRHPLPSGPRRGPARGRGLKASTRRSTSAAASISTSAARPMSVGCAPVIRADPCQSRLVDGWIMPASWRASLRPAAFRGVPFLLLTAEGEHGRRLASHEYPLRDEPWHEDLGRKAKVLRLDGFVLEPGHIAKAKALIEAVEKPGPGVLTHPWLGDLTMVVTECRVRFSHAEGGMAAFALAFAEAGESLYPAPVNNAAGVVDRAAATAKSAISGRFLQNFSLDKVAGWVADSAGGLLKDAFTSMGPIGEGIVSGVGKAAAWAGDLNQALGTVTTIVRNPAALVGRVLGLTDLGNLAGITALVQTPLAVRTAIDSFIRPGAGALSWQSFLPLSRFSATVTALLDDDSYHYAGGGRWEPGPAPDAAGGSYYGGAGGSSTVVPAARRQDQVNRTELAAFVRRAAVIEMARTAVRADFAAANEATAAAHAIATAVDRELATAGDEDGQALQALAIAAQQAIAGRVPELQRAIVFTTTAPPAAVAPPALDALGRRFGYVPGATLPAIVIAHVVYGDAIADVAPRAEEIVARNRIPHPGFVPGGEPLELLSVA